MTVNHWDSSENLRRPDLFLTLLREAKPHLSPMSKFSPVRQVPDGNAGDALLWEHLDGGSCSAALCHPGSSHTKNLFQHKEKKNCSAYLVGEARKDAVNSR